MQKRDVVVIGAGPAGLAAALSLKENGIEDVLVVEREDYAGGLLHQCIHNGFGLHRFREELTGPEYAERYLESARERSVQIQTGTVVLDIKDEGEGKGLYLLSEQQGYLEISAGAVILAMGCREKNRGNINIPGSRPAGIMTAGLAQRMVNLEGYLPGREVVILGSGDIGLIMARRLTWEGAHVKGVVEIQPYPGGLNRNIDQCLRDFAIPLYLSHTITEIRGNPRVEAVEVSPIDTHHEPRKKGRFVLGCDTLLLSVGLVPENELSLKAGIVLDPVTLGPVVNSNLMTNVSGIFACGNVLHVHDLVDYVSEEGEYCGKKVAMFLKDGLPKKDGLSKKREIPVKAGNLVRYVLPSTVELVPQKGEAVPQKREATDRVMLFLRPIVPAEDPVLLVKSGEEIIYRRKYRKVFPSNMIRIPVKGIPEDSKGLEVGFQIQPSQ